MTLKANNKNPEGMGRTETSTVLSVEPTLDQFKWFINEREMIRKKKDEGLPRPWTNDEVLDKTKFTNIYRQHDKVSQFIFSRLGDSRVEGPNLVYNLLLSRLINRVDVLHNVIPTSPREDISFLLDGDAIVMNSSAYQVHPGLCKLDDYDTNIQTCLLYTSPSPRDS